MSKKKFYNVLSLTVYHFWNFAARLIMKSVAIIHLVDSCDFSLFPQTTNMTLFVQTQFSTYKWTAWFENVVVHIHV